MESTKNCNNYPKRVFGSELAPESFFVPVRSSKEVPSSANSIISLLNTYGVAVVEFEENESARQQLLCFGQLFGNTMRHDRSDYDGNAGSQRWRNTIGKRQETARMASLKG